MDREISTAEATLRWWRHPDHFDWITGYLRARGILRNTRFLIALMTLSLVVTAVPLMFSPAESGFVKSDNRHSPSTLPALFALLRSYS